MSTSTTKPLSDNMPAIPQFSYAQAAKSKPQKQPASSGAIGTAVSTETGPKRTVSSDRATVAGAQEKGSAKRTASEGRMPENTDRIEKAEAESSSTTEAKGGFESDVTINSNPEEESKPTLAPTSPEFGSASASTLPKEEDLFSSVNGSSDSNWDKQSQSSQNGNKATDQLEPGDHREMSKGHKWDEDIAMSPSLKEAPPPSKNIWQQRREAQEAKKAKFPPGSQTTAGKSASEQETSSAPIKATDATIDVKKSETKKKTKHPPDEKAQNEGAKATNKDRKAKTNTEGEIMLHPSVLIFVN